MAALLSAHNRAVADRRSDHELRLQLVQDLRDARNKVKVAALLINANKSPIMYGQQMDELLVARVSLLDVEWAVQARPRLCGGEGRTQLIGALLRQTANYLEAIVEEYGWQYDRISAIQLFSSKWDEEQAYRLSKKADPPQAIQMRTSLVPWTEMTNQQAFPKLTDLRLDTKNHDSGFSGPLEQAITIIIEQDERR